MPIIFKVMYPLQLCTSGTHLQCQIDWTKYVLYQKGMDEELSCPADAKHSITGAGCQTLADKLIGFCNIDYLPNTTIDVARLGDDMQATFQRTRVKWLDSCRLEFNSTQLLRTDKMKAPYMGGYSRSAHEVPSAEWRSNTTIKR